MRGLLPWKFAGKQTSKTSVEIPTRAANSLNDNDEVAMATKKNLEFSTLFSFVNQYLYLLVYWGGKVPLLLTM